MDISTDATKHWRPECDDDIQPYARQRFETVEQGIEFYRAYSKVAGFDIETGRRGENSKALHCTPLDKRCVCTTNV
nr:protein FAR1-RELATED SEQUENCE 5-like [Ipomoea trifida]